MQIFSPLPSETTDSLSPHSFVRATDVQAGCDRDDATENPAWDSAASANPRTQSRGPALLFWIVAIENLRINSVLIKDAFVAGQKAFSIGEVLWREPIQVLSIPSTTNVGLRLSD